MIVPAFWNCQTRVSVPTTIPATQILQTHQKEYLQISTVASRHGYVFSESVILRTSLFRSKHAVNTMTFQNQNQNPNHHHHECYHHGTLDDSSVVDTTRVTLNHPIRLSSSNASIVLWAQAEPRKTWQHVVSPVQTPGYPARY